MSSPNQRLRTQIADRGSITFAEFMDEALYGIGGYYAQESFPVGIEGDFVTGSSLSPLFGKATAKLVRRLDKVLDRSSDVLELGYGSGAHLSGLIQGLGGVGSRSVLAVDRICRPTPDGVRAVDGLRLIEPRSVRGLIFSYELFDAIPVHRLIGRHDGTVGELWVVLGDNEEFRFKEGDLSDENLLTALGGDASVLEVGQIADIAPGWRVWYQKLADRLGSGLLVTCDYGFERPRLLDPRVRFHGTLACYRQHRVHRDALSAVGEQDLTAHVDFTALQREGEAAGLVTVAFTRQARWLMACGLFEQLQEADQATRLQAIDLLNPAGMGEEIRVLVQARDIDPAGLFDVDLLTD